MKKLKYFIEFLVIVLLFLIFRIVGYKVASNFGYFIGINVGSKFRSREIIKENLRKFKTSINNHEIEEITKKMWGNYGRILAEYQFIGR